MTALAKIPVRMTVDEFLRWDSGDDRYELVDGEPHAMAPTSNTHGLLLGELGGLIRNHLRSQGSHCDVIINPGVVPHLLSDHNFRIPDLAVTCAAVPPGPKTLPDPVLIVEILSPGNQAKTWANVWAYTSIPGLREILVLRSDRVAVELLRRSPSGEWPSRTADVADGELELQSIGFRLSLADLYARTGLVK
jgi:Uma2 family endonuclease